MENESEMKVRNVLFYASHITVSIFMLVLDKTTQESEIFMSSKPSLLVCFACLLFVKNKRWELTHKKDFQQNLERSVIFHVINMINT
ncbi:CLUMA_CG015507, isoform A [Clunio marinus]|uniref:CLUMA_CG015507, isoform A n=1 Tax=Clunio marinus TaxID=568069 RepID=A0A1J1ISE1_9DIPT|nr:CLUMA_CG015507, isoform A [Clunio marinus]